MFDLSGKIAVVTGAGRGIGKNIAVKLAQAKAKVIIIGRNKAAGEALSKDLCSRGLDIEFLSCDVSIRRKAESLLKKILKKHRAIDILINNAKDGKRTSPLKETEDNYIKTLDILLKAPLFMSQVLINQAQQGGVILNISSVITKYAGRESCTYNTAKAALESLTRYLALYGGAQGFRVNAISPGFIVQDEHEARYARKENKRYRDVSEFCHPLKRVGSSDDIANAALFLCSNAAAFITGQVLTVDGGLSIQNQWELIDRFSKAEI